MAAAGAGPADRVALIDAQRRELMRRLREVQRLAESQPAGDDDGVLLLEGSTVVADASRP